MPFFEPMEFYSKMTINVAVAPTSLQAAVKCWYFWRGVKIFLLFGLESINFHVLKNSCGSKSELYSGLLSVYMHYEYLSTAKMTATHFLLLEGRNLEEYFKSIWRENSKEIPKIKYVSVNHELIVSPILLINMLINAIKQREHSANSRFILYTYFWRPKISFLLSFVQ